MQSKNQNFDGIEIWIERNICIIFGRCLYYCRTVHFLGSVWTGAVEHDLCTRAFCPRREAIARFYLALMQRVVLSGIILLLAEHCSTGFNDTEPFLSNTNPFAPEAAAYWFDQAALLRRGGNDGTAHRCEKLAERVSAFPAAQRRNRHLLDSTPSLRIALLYNPAEHHALQDQAFLLLLWSLLDAGGGMNGTHTPRKGGSGAEPDAADAPQAAGLRPGKHWRTFKFRQ